MLTTILPGLREVRAPLAAGFVWLACIWLGVGERIPPSAPTDALLALPWRAAEWLGATALLATLSFTAYVLGSCLSLDVARLPEPVSRWISGNKGESSEEKLLARHVVDLAKKAELNGWPPMSPEAAIESLHVEQRSLAAALLKHNERLYDQQDRLRAEAEFRLNLVVPLLVLAILLAVRLSPWFLTIVGIALIYARQGSARLSEARDRIWHAVRSGDIETFEMGELRKRSLETPSLSGYNTSSGWIERLPNNKVRLPDGTELPGSEIIDRDGWSTPRGELVPVGTRRFSDGSLLFPPWTGEPVKHPFLQHEDETVWHANGKRYKNIKAMPGNL